MGGDHKRPLRIWLLEKRKQKKRWPLYGRGATECATAFQPRSGLGGFWGYLTLLTSRSVHTYEAKYRQVGGDVITIQIVG